MATLFISDLHLDPSRPEITRAFLNFLDHDASSADALYILGDFFEAWIGDDDDSDLNQQVISALRHLSHSGVDVYLMHGNRDFLLGEQFCSQTGCNLLPDPTTINLHDQTVLLMHGDSLCTDDTQYQAFRKQVRDPAWQQAMLSKPLHERRAIAEQMRSASQAANSNKASQIMDVNSDAVRDAMTRHQSQLLIHGHTHRPAIHKDEASNNIRIVLGDWDAYGWVLTINRDRSFELKKFAITH